MDQVDGHTRAEWIARLEGDGVSPEQIAQIIAIAFDGDPGDVLNIDERPDLIDPEDPADG